MEFSSRHVQTAVEALHPEQARHLREQKQQGWGLQQQQKEKAASPQKHLRSDATERCGSIIYEIQSVLQQRRINST